MLVHSVLQNDISYALSQYFMYQEHCENKRNDKCSVRFPRVRTESVSKGIFYIVATAFDELPLSARMTDNAFAFRKIMINIHVQGLITLII